MRHGKQSVHQAGRPLGHHQQRALHVVYVLVQAVPDQIVEVFRLVALPPIEDVIDGVGHEVVRARLAHGIVDPGVHDRVIVHLEEDIRVVGNAGERACEIDRRDLIRQDPLATHLLREDRSVLDGELSRCDGVHRAYLLTRIQRLGLWVSPPLSVEGRRTATSHEREPRCTWKLHRQPYELHMLTSGEMG